MFKYLLAVTVISFPSIVFSASEPPSPRPSISTQQKQSDATPTNKESAEDKRGTKPMPLVVELLPSEKSKEHAAQEASDRESKATNDRITALSSAVIAFFTIVLAIVSFFQWRVANKNAISAGETAKAVIAADRAWLVPGCGFRAAGDHPKRAIIMSIKNSGRTAAFLKSIKWGVVNETDFTDELKHNAPEILAREDIIPGQVSEIPIHRVTIAVAGNEGKIFFGRVDYADVYGIQRFSTWKHRIEDTGGTTPLDGAYSDYS